MHSYFSNLGHSGNPGHAEFSHNNRSGLNDLNQLPLKRRIPTAPAPWMANMGVEEKVSSDIRSIRFIVDCIPHSFVDLHLYPLHSTPSR
jgi:hypothetical protein